MDIFADSHQTPGGNACAGFPNSLPSRRHSAARAHILLPLVDRIPGRAAGNEFEPGGARVQPRAEKSSVVLEKWLGEVSRSLSLWISFWHTERVKKRRGGSRVFNVPIKGLDDEKYRGQWLVIERKSGRIAVHKESLAEAQKEAEKQHIQHPAIYRVPSTDTHYVVVK